MNIESLTDEQLIELRDKIYTEVSSKDIHQLTIKIL